MLQNMQKKLDDLCEQMNSSKDQFVVNHLLKNSLDSNELTDNVMSEGKEADLYGCGHLFPQLDPESGNPLSGNLSSWPKVRTSQVFDGSPYSFLFFSSLMSACCVNIG